MNEILFIITKNKELNKVKKKISLIAGVVVIFALAIFAYNNTSSASFPSSEEYKNSPEVQKKFNEMGNKRILSELNNVVEIASLTSSETELYDITTELFERKEKISNPELFDFIKDKSNLSLQ